MSATAAQPIPGIPDYSTVHTPLGEELFSHVKDSSLWPQFKWDAELVSQYWRDGYVANIPILTPDQCDLILQDYSYFTHEGCKHPGQDMLYEFHSNQSGDPDNVLVHVLGHWRLTKFFHDVAFHPKIVVPASQLLVQGEEKAVRFWHDQLFAKPPKHGGVVAWHQDYSYWTRTSPMCHLTVHIALDDQTEENGTLFYIPKSHTWKRNDEPLPVLDFNFKDMEGIKTILTEEELAIFKPKASLLKKGEASFHHPLMVHGSYGNKSDRPRRAAVLNYFADGVFSKMDGPLLKKQDTNSGYPQPKSLDSKYEKLFGASNIPKGQKMGGQFYPLVYDPHWAK